jgi:hypothetical protein
MKEFKIIMAIVLALLVLTALKVSYNEHIQCDGTNHKYSRWDTNYSSTTETRRCHGCGASQIRPINKYKTQ